MLACGRQADANILTNVGFHKMKISTYITDYITNITDPFLCLQGSCAYTKFGIFLIRFEDSIFRFNTRLLEVWNCLLIL
jgi:hypothetical protein